MQFQEGHIFHIYNQGNNRRKVFFSERNYRFFIQKIKTHVLPYADVLAWCLMPNHFHLMVYVKMVDIEGFSQSETLASRTINDSIGILLRSYTRAINKQENMTGSLFRKETKAKCISCNDGIIPNFLNTSINFRIPEKQYPQICFNYIHQNPVNAGLVDKEIDWLFSSASSYMQNIDDELVNKGIASQFVKW